MDMDIEVSESASISEPGHSNSTAVAEKKGSAKTGHLPW